MADARRGRGYGRRWQAARLRHLAREPLCRYCAAQGRTRAATVVDHIAPHRGDSARFWDSSNWQSLCKPCHDGAKSRLERGGTLPGCALDGTPLDPSHPWNDFRFEGEGGV